MKFFKVLLFFLILGMVSFGVLSIIISAKSNETLKRETLEQKSTQTANIPIDIGSDLSRLEIAELLGKTLGWDESDITSFASTWGQMQWAEFNVPFTSILSKKLKWKDDQKEIFLTNSTQYFTNPKLDFFGKLYIPGNYIIPKEYSLAQIAGLLIDRTKEVEAVNMNDFITENISPDELNNVQKFVQSEYELLPDLVPLPPQDVQISKDGKKTLLLFTTVYYNQGRGPLELVADSKTKNIKKDVERNVFQRIYLPDGKYRDRVAGKFLWHQSHLHYHFEDFILYDLEPVDVIGDMPNLSGNYVKSTFCIRDVSQVVLDLDNIEKKAKYQICGKEKQGISVGWGDAYFYTYPDQNLDISNIPTGLYRLTFKSNPDNLFEESNYENNESSVLVSIDMEEKKVLVIESVPDKIPKFKHVYPVQENCASCIL